MSVAELIASGLIEREQALSWVGRGGEDGGGEEEERKDRVGQKVLQKKFNEEFELNLEDFCTIFAPSGFR